MGCFARLLLASGFLLIRLQKLLAPLAIKFANIANNPRNNKSLDYGRGIFVFMLIYLLVCLLALLIIYLLTLLPA